jgi:hypothetical protein
VEPGGRFRVRKNPTLVPVLTQINLVHTTISHLFKIHFNTSVRSSANFSVPFRFSEYNFAYISYLSNACYMPLPSNLKVFKGHIYVYNKAFCLYFVCTRFESWSKTPLYTSRFVFASVPSDMSPQFLQTCRHSAFRHVATVPSDMSPQFLQTCRHSAFRHVATVPSDMSPQCLQIPHYSFLKNPSRLMIHVHLLPQYINLCI